MATATDVKIGMNDPLEKVFAFKTETRLWFGCQIKTFGRLLQYSEATLRKQYACLDDEDIAEIKARLADLGLALAQPKPKG